MSILVVGLSHKSAPVATLERAVLTGDALVKLLRDVAGCADVAGSLVLSTCNRIEVYAEVDTFHGGVSAVSELLARHSGIALDELTRHLHVHYQDRAVQHLLAVACGLESMVVGESQILGQVRRALGLARHQGTLSRELSGLGALALHTGKRAHAETGIGRAGASLVSVGLTAAAQRLGSRAAGQGGLAGRPALIVGAGSMSSLAVAAAARMGAAPITVANRTVRHAERIAATVCATATDLSGLAAHIASADLVVSCTGAAGTVITAAAVRDALRKRDCAARPLVLLDLALPRDIAAAAGQLPGVTVIGLEALGHARSDDPGVPAHAADVAAVRRIVAQEFAAHASADLAASVAPTVVALRAKAAEVVEAELARLAGRLAGLDARSHREIAKSMRRIADKLLHAPTVRVKELAGSPGAESYELALRVLFDLDPAAVLAVTRADAGLVPWPGEASPAPRPGAAAPAPLSGAAASSSPGQTAPASCAGAAAPAPAPGQTGPRPVSPETGMTPGPGAAGSGPRPGEEAQ
jgi:glutamyl-tRNA reductase